MEMEKVGSIITGRRMVLGRGHWFACENRVYDLFGKQLKATGIGVYAALCRYRNTKTGVCCPSIDKLSKTLGDRKTVIKHLNTLESIGIITRHKNMGRSTHYTFASPDKLMEIFHQLSGESGTASSGKSPP